MQQTSGCDCVPIKLYFQKHGPNFSSLLNSGMELWTVSCTKKKESGLAFLWDCIAQRRVIIKLQRLQKPQNLQRAHFSSSEGLVSAPSDASPEPSQGCWRLELHSSLTALALFYPSLHTPWSVLLTESGRIPSPDSPQPGETQLWHPLTRIQWKSAIHFK